ncbi:hypothetical protein ALC60_02649, partial [Trachymyrmex zeteki]
KINLHIAKQYNHGTCNCIFLKRSFFRVTSREEVVMQLALGRKTGSANHPTCLFSFFFFSFPRIRRGMTGASTRSSYICTRLEPDSGEQPSSSSSSSSFPFSRTHSQRETPPEK